MVSRAGAVSTAVVIAVGVVLAAIVEEKVLPVGPRHRPVAAPGPARGGARHTPTSRSTERHKPVSPAVLLDRQVQKLALSRRGAAARSEYGVQTVASPVVRQSRSDKKRGWVLGTEAIPPPDDSTAMPEASLFLAHATGTTWKAALAGSPDFAAMVTEAPASVLSDGERAALRKFDTARSAPSEKAGGTPLMLPWTIGQSWTLVPTDRGLSFDGGDGRVLAASAGRVYRLCSSSPDRGLVLVIGDDGTATEYYQLDRLTEVPDGERVRQGDYLGHTGTDQPCGGGAASRPLVRFGLRGADGPVSLDGRRIGGWTVHDAPGEAFAERDGVRVQAGNPLLNFGIDVSSSPSPSPSRSKTSPAPDPHTAPRGVDAQT
ncbi:M23 family metallopeptidase [Actinoallomurus acaciae]|uniref:M23 family metallopeptidase n=1 Tax=Actinoallomurus acaciae TaxID=502577 RepID=A0ABV5YB18_9ACTN